LKTKLTDIVARRKEFKIQPRTIKHDCRNHSGSKDWSTERSIERKFEGEGVNLKSIKYTAPGKKVKPIVYTTVPTIESDESTPAI